VADLERSLAFYGALGYEVVGSVPETPLGELTMLRLPDDEFVSIELVAGPTPEAPDPRGALSHLVVQVDSLDDVIAALAASGIPAEAPTSPDGRSDFRTSWIADPDGNRIELVQWPAGHAAGMTAADLG
jgi:lactoylglutathione lyase